MNWLWLLLVVPLVFSAAFVIGAACCYDRAYQDGFQAGHRHYHANGPY